MRKLLNCYIAKLLYCERQRTVTIQQFIPGFSLIELMIVLTLFGLATAYVTASYLQFEKAQRLKNAALQMVSDLRYVQNKATEQDKGAGGLCPSTSTLGGWYLLVDTTSSSTNNYYKIGGDCVTGTIEPNEALFYDAGQPQRTIKLPRDIRITQVIFSAGPLNPVAILYRPQKVGVTFHNGGLSFPRFFQSDGKTFESEFPTNVPVTIELANSSDDKYLLVIQPNGEVNEVKP